MIQAIANFDANVHDVKAAMNTIFAHSVGMVRAWHKPDA